MHKVFLVEDHSLTRAGIKEILSKVNAAVAWVGEASTIKEALELIPIAKPDILLLDLGLPDGNGYEVARFVRKNFPNIRILVISQLAGNNLIASLKELKVLGFVSKSSPAENIIFAFNKILSGEEVFIYDNYSDKNPSPEGQLLTEREILVIKFISKGFTVKEIAEKLDCSPETIKYHKKNIMKKTLARNGAELAALAVINNWG